MHLKNNYKRIVKQLRLKIKDAKQTYYMKEFKNCNGN